MTVTHAVPIAKRRRWRAFLADRQGATAVEFALQLPLKGWRPGSSFAMESSDGKHRKDS